MNNFHKWWLGILTFIVVAETTLIGIYCCSKLEINSNSPSVLISALGVLVTFVVAWQIWQTMASKEEIKEARETVKRMDSLETEVKSIVPMTDAHFHFSLATALQVKGLEVAELRSVNFDGEEKQRLAQKALYTCMAFSQYLLTLKMYSDIESRATDYIAYCMRNIENMAMRMRSNYDLVTTGLINIMISDVDSVLTQCGKSLTTDQIAELQNIKQELERNLPNGIDAEAALKERQRQRDRRYGNQTGSTESPTPSS